VAWAQLHSRLMTPCYHLHTMQQRIGCRLFSRTASSDRSWYIHLKKQARIYRILCIALLSLLVVTQAIANDSLRIGSKRFTESYLLGEVLTGTVRNAGISSVEHKPGLGNTAILFAALKSGAIDIYPDYTGTVALELLRLPAVPTLDVINRHLAAHGLAAGVLLGFSNSYALAMQEKQAAQRSMRRISDLTHFNTARLGLSAEFLNRRDGWPALSAAYDLRGLTPRGLDHGLAYEALAQDQVDVIDVYTTDPKIARYRMRVLEDDRNFFPEYQSLLIYRADLPQQSPRIWSALQSLQDSITASDMMQMSAAVELQGRNFSEVAGEWLRDKRTTQGPTTRPALWDAVFGQDLARLTLEHLLLVGASLLLSVLTGIPLGIWAQRAPRAGRWILTFTGVLQTIPSLALLAFLIALLDRIGAVPAILALFLYALLPIVRNTEAALAGISRGMREAGQALGLTARQQVRLIEMPLAMPGILAGIKTATVINVGTATIAAFIGAGGFGERIVAGLAVNDHQLLLAGAIPAAVLAIVLEWGFRWLERRLIAQRMQSAAGR